jgi:hypothetical protein
VSHPPSAPTESVRQKWSFWPTIGPERFASAYNLDVSVEKLRDATARDFRRRIYSRSKFGGTVTRERVILWRATRNAWAPVFFGEFFEEGGAALSCRVASQAVAFFGL